MAFVLRAKATTEELKAGAYVQQERGMWGTDEIGVVTISCSVTGLSNGVAGTLRACFPLHESWEGQSC